MRTNRIFGVVFALCVSVLSAEAVPPEWKYYQELRVSAAGFVRTQVSIDLIDIASPDLQDMRVFAGDGREVPFLLESPKQPHSTWLEPILFDVSAEPRRTVIFMETEKDMAVEGARLEMPGKEFLKSASVEGSKDGRVWTSLARHYPIFRQAGAQSLTMDWPSGRWPFLRIILDDERSAPVAVTGCDVRLSLPTLPAVQARAIPIVGRAGSPDQTLLKLELPARGLTWSRFVLEIADPFFVRRIALLQTYFDGRSVQEATTGEGVIFRVAGGRILDIPVEFGTWPSLSGGNPDISSQTGLDLWAQMTDRHVTFRIQNEHNPPLDVRSIKGHFVPIFLAFQTERPGTFFLAAGSQSAVRPAYDLEGLNRFLKSEPLLSAAAGPLLRNPAYVEPEPLPYVSGVGAPIDVSAWRYRKRVLVERSAVYEIELDMDMLSSAQPDGRDIRLVSPAGLQIPYVFDYSTLIRDTGIEAVEAADENRPNVSRWKLKLPRPRLPITTIGCEVDALLFQRDVVLYEEAEAGEGVRRPRPRLRDLARIPARPRRNHHWDGESFDIWREMGRSTWTRTSPAKTVYLTLPVRRPPQGDELILEIDNGDNPPLRPHLFKSYYRTFRVAFKAPGDSEMFVSYGNVQVTFPRYDLALVSREILSAGKSTASLGPQELIQPPWWWDFHAGTSTTRALFWIVLSVVAVGLLVIIARLLPTSEDAASTKKAGPDG